MTDKLNVSMNISNLDPGLRHLVAALLIEHRAVSEMALHTKPSALSRAACEAVVIANAHARQVIVEQAHSLILHGFSRVKP